MDTAAKACCVKVRLELVVAKFPFVVDRLVPIRLFVSLIVWSVNSLLVAISSLALLAKVLLKACIKPNKLNRGTIITVLRKRDSTIINTRLQYTHSAIARYLSV